MCLHKLYADLVVLTGTEFPLPHFFVAVDAVCRGWLAKYPQKLLCAGEYTPPTALADVLPLADCLYPALLDSVARRRKTPIFHSGAPPRAANGKGGTTGE